MTIASTQISHVAVERLEAFLAQQREQRTVEERDGLLREVSEQGGGKFLYAYDEAGDLAQIVEADGSIVSFSYDERRRLVQTRDEKIGTTTYRYDDASDHLVEIATGGVRQRFEHDEMGRLLCVRRGDAGATLYSYDEWGRVTRARTAVCSTEHEYDMDGRVTLIRQTLDGLCLTLRLSYDRAGCLSSVELPGSRDSINYEWDRRGRPAAINLGPRNFARFEYEDEERAMQTHFANGVVECSLSDRVDGRLLRQEVRRGETLLAQRINEYETGRQLRQDGVRRYEYDALGRLARAVNMATGEHWAYDYDACDNLVAMNEKSLTCDGRGCVVLIETVDRKVCELSYDERGRLRSKGAAGREEVFRYDDAGQLIEVLRNGNAIARFTYDHKGRLVAMRADDATERYLYGPGDELFAVTDAAGQPQRIFVRTPFGCVGEVRGALATGETFFMHSDERGLCYLVTDARGEVVALPHVDPFGAPLSAEASQAPVAFCGRKWFAEVNLYYFGARWYDPALGRFLTPDTFTARPDDERIVNALNKATEQARLREHLLPNWLKRPRLRHAYAYCGNDPVNCVDPNGHWSIGYVLLSILGAIWTLPNTVFGLLIEVTCLVGEVVRWLVYAFTAGNVSWKTPGFDVASSGRLNAYALVFEGGWLGSFENLLGITFGNVFFVYKDWRTHPAILALDDEVAPPVYNGEVKIPREQALYEHELRHTNQYQWLGPFFHLGLPLWGAYEWEVILHGYGDAWMEADAREHGGL
jgi:RHS repeat-associated protein